MTPERPDGGGAFPKPVERPASPIPDPADLYAALDLGTNSCRMLIAQPKGSQFHVVDSFSKSVGLGQGLGGSGRLSRASMARTVQALKICRRKREGEVASIARVVENRMSRGASRDYKRADRRRDSGPCRKSPSSTGAIFRRR